MIFVFKTSVKTKIQIKKLKPHIDNLLLTAEWNFDLEDCDKILHLTNETVIFLLNDYTRTNQKVYCQPSGTQTQ